MFCHCNSNPLVTHMSPIQLGGELFKGMCFLLGGKKDSRAAWSLAIIITKEEAYGHSQVYESWYFTNWELKHPK